MRRLWTPEEDEFLQEHFPALGAVATSRLMGRGRTSISNHARKLGLQADKYVAELQIRHDYFTVIDSPIKAYVLGWLATDGNIVATSNEIRIELHKKDHILGVRKFASGSHLHR